MMKTIMIVLGVLFMMHELHAQNKFNYQNVIPPSPEVAAIAKYVDMPVSYSTGIPQIGIPIYTVSSGSLQVPVSLSYNAGGIRVEEASTWVGLGWNLSTGGSLSRVVRGLPDETPYQGYMNVPAYKKVSSIRPFELGHGNKWTAFEEVSDRLDLEADIFNFSAMGYSGKFSYDQDLGKFVLIPYQNIKIDYEGDFSAFIITLPNGVKCYFGKSQDGARYSVEKTESTQVTSLQDGVSSQGPPSLSNHLSMWSLMDIVAPNNFNVRFFYTQETAYDFGRGSETMDYMVRSSGGSHPTWSTSASFQYSKTYKPVLTKISTDQCDVFFIAQNPRLDVKEGTSKSLDAIEVKTKAGRLIKSFVFNYEYFTSTDIVNLWGLADYTNIATKRLKLKSVTEAGLPSYEFTYDETPLPSRLSSSQDYWGFYNGKNNGLMLMPRWHTGGYVGLPEGYTNGANRDIDTVLTQAGLLKSIKYPTGGSTQYYYEQNRASIMYYKAMGNFERPDLVDKKVTFPALRPEDPNTLSFSQTFTVTQPGTKVKIVASLEGCLLNYPSNTCPHHVMIKGITNPSYTYTFSSMSGEFYLELPDGKYEISNNISQGVSPVPGFSVELNWREIPDANNFLVGGVRIKKIASFSGDGTGVSRRYAYDMGINTSSGILFGNPVHSYEIPLDYFAQDVQGGNSQMMEVVNPWAGDGVTPETPYKVPVYVSQSAVPLTPDGQLIHYMFVTEYFDSTRTSFKNEYIYNNDWDYYTDYKSNVPVPTPLRDWRKSLMQKKVYELSENNYRILYEEQNNYRSDSTTNRLSGMKCTYVNYTVAGNGTGTNPFIPKHIGDVSFYNVATEWYLLESSVVTQHSYTNGHKSQSVTTNYFYNNQKLLSETNTKNSKAQNIVSLIYYPSDYNSSVTGNLVSKHILDVPIKQESHVDGSLKASVITQYDANGVPVSIYNYETAGLTPLIYHDPAVLLPAGFKNEAELSYTDGYLTKVYKGGTMPQEIKYAWNVFANAPVMEITANKGNYYAYTSFETNDPTVNWNGIKPTGLLQGGVTGKGCYLLDYPLSTTLDPSIEYLLTYWTTNASAYTITGTNGTPMLLRTVSINGQSWKCFQHTISGQSSVTLTGGGMVDEVRIHSSKAQMRTFTYEPMVGTLTTNDNNNIITYYEYDAQNRLKLLRDHNYYIRKQFCYNYNGQQTECYEAQTLLPPPSPCAGCTGANQMCIDNVCHTGVKVRISSVRIGPSSWRCTYVYEFPGTVYTSPEFIEISNGPCPL